MRINSHDRPTAVIGGNLAQHHRRFPLEASDLNDGPWCGYTGGDCPKQARFVFPQETRNGPGSLPGVLENRIQIAGKVHVLQISSCGELRGTCNQCLILSDRTSCPRFSLMRSVVRYDCGYSEAPCHPSRLLHPESLCPHDQTFPTPPRMGSTRDTNAGPPRQIKNASSGRGERDWQAIMKRWSRRAMVFLVAAAIALYAGDWLVFNLRGSVTGTVTVSRFLSAPLTNNREELDFLGSEEVTCSVSLFPQGGNAPCWYLRRHRNQIKRI